MVPAPIIFTDLCGAKLLDRLTCQILGHLTFAKNRNVVFGSPVERQKQLIVSNLFDFTSFVRSLGFVEIAAPRKGYVVFGSPQIDCPLLSPATAAAIFLKGHWGPPVPSRRHFFRRSWSEQSGSRRRGNTFDRFLKQWTP